MLERVTQSGSADSFAWYGLALEYRSLGRAEEALKTFEVLKEKDPSYVPMYLMAAQICVERAEPAVARHWASEGVSWAMRKHDGHAQGELESFLATLPEP